MEEDLLGAREQYAQALKAGQKYYRNAVINGEYPFPPALDDIVSEQSCAGRQELGQIEIPAELIVGTKVVSRQAAFAGNFMPLLDQNSEFGTKWINLCAAHLGNTGIRDPIKCYEYMGRFYVQEGNKRVSVFKSFGATRIRGVVTRIIPVYSEDPAVQLYYEFLRFYELSHLYQVHFTRSGNYEKLQAALGLEKDRVWTETERRRFLAGFSRLQDFLKNRGEKDPSAVAGDVLLSWLAVYPFSDLNDMTAAELTKALDSIQKSVESVAHDNPIDVKTDPPEQQKSLVNKLLGFVRSEHVTAAFIYTANPEDSRWIMAHETGRQYLERALGERVTTLAYVCTIDKAEETMETAIAEGADTVFAVTPTLINACRKIAAKHPQVKVLNCSLTAPYPGVRSYYSRMYETKFVAGAIAGAMSENNKIGYVADYPIFGVPAAINAFVLGARCVNPRAQVKLRWSCLEREPVGALQAEGCTVVSRQESISRPKKDRDWSLYMLTDENTARPLASTSWVWGRFYERVVRSILNGSYGSDSGYTAINYWWGIRSGVIDLELADNLPDGVTRLAKLLINGVAEGRIEPFRATLTDQVGVRRNEGMHGLSPEEIMNMDYLLDCVDGYIPAYDELRSEAQPLVRYLGLYRDYLPPEKEEATQL